MLLFGCFYLAPQVIGLFCVADVSHDSGTNRCSTGNAPDADSSDLDKQLHTDEGCYASVLLGGINFNRFLII